MAEEQRLELRGTLADEEAAMRSGKAGSLVVMGLLALTALGGLFYLMGGEDQARVYGDLGKKINGLKQAQFDQFWGCALQGADLRDVHSNTDLETQLDLRARDKGQAYGEHLRDACLPLLESIGPALDTLILSGDLQTEVKELSEANGKLRSAVSGFVTYLDDPELEYDQDAARPHIQGMARAWYEFKRGHGAINQLIRTKIGE